jgi:hypothetical protein
MDNKDVVGSINQIPMGVDRPPLPPVAPVAKLGPDGEPEPVGTEAQRKVGKEVSDRMRPKTTPASSVPHVPASPSHVPASSVPHVPASSVPHA